MQHPDMNYTVVSTLQAERRAKASLRRRLRATAADLTNDEPGQARPAWLEHLDRCVQEPAAEVVVVIDLQGAAIRRPGDVGAATHTH
jgi:hypothetical protein